MPAFLWSGNLRLSLILIPVQLHAATTEGKVAFRQIDAPSGNPIHNMKGVRDGENFTEVPDEDMGKHTIDIVRFVGEADIDTRHLEKPYYLTPDGDEPTKLHCHS